MRCRVLQCVARAGRRESVGAVCVCVCERERVSVSVCVCACVCAFMCAVMSVHMYVCE